MQMNIYGYVDVLGIGSVIIFSSGYTLFEVTLN